jgi:aminopeptidase-like protein
MGQQLEPSDHCDVGEWMHGFIARLYPICRSITGDGFRETLRRIREHIPLEISEVRTGTKVFDWTVPKEWNVRDAWVKNECAPLRAIGDRPDREAARSGNREY